MKVYWTEQARSHLRAIHDYVALTSSDYARNTVDRLTRRSEQLGIFPRSGHIVPEFDIDPVREVLEGSYRIIYAIEEDRIDILAVIHGSRKVLLDE
jgi:plasmid stabilization system protein ParE